MPLLFINLICVALNSSLFKLLLHLGYIPNSWSLTFPKSLRGNNWIFKSVLLIYNMAYKPQCEPEWQAKFSPHQSIICSCFLLWLSLSNWELHTWSWKPWRNNDPKKRNYLRGQTFILPSTLQTPFGAEQVLKRLLELTISHLTELDGCFRYMWWNFINLAIEIKCTSCFQLWNKCDKTLICWQSIICKLYRLGGKLPY